MSESETTTKPKQWFVVHTYSGFENKVAHALACQVRWRCGDDRLGVGAEGEGGGDPEEQEDRDRAEFLPRLPPRGDGAHRRHLAPRALAAEGHGVGGLGGQAGAPPRRRGRRD